MSPRPDLLSDVPQQRRRARELADFEFIRQNADSQFAYPADIASGLINRAAGPGKPMQSMPAGTEVNPDSVVMCARVDLDHPIFLADNIFAICADCECDVQHRPEAPTAATKLCICCTARRIREEKKE